MSKKGKMVRARHSSLEMPDAEVVVKKKQDMLTKARNKLMNLGEVLKATKTLDGDHQKKPVTHAIDYLFKHYPKDKNHVYTNTHTKKNALQKQNSVGSYPIKIEITQDSDEEKGTIQRSRPATVCIDKLSEGIETAALALERPRKKLSFREPEITGYSFNNQARKRGDKSGEPELRRSSSYCNGILHRSPSFEDSDLESQAMRVVRTIGQAFEVCHKLSINAPENDAQDQDEQDTLTQDLLSDRLSDITSDKPKKDILSEGASDKMSLPPDDASLRDNSYIEFKVKPQQLDILPPPPVTNNKKSPLTSAETYSSPHSDVLTSGSGSGGSNSLPPPGTALSAHHELQLLREQLEQQSQQTQAAMAQLQLAREQLAAEQSARLEAQARTHQLLIHNRELLDHIAALVAHLQGGEKSGQQQTPPHVTMPQQQQPGSGDNYVSDHLSETASLDNSSAFQSLGLNPQGLIENRAVTSCLPTSPLRTNFNPTGTVFNFSYPPPMDPNFDSQLFQRLQNISGYSSPSYSYNYQTLPFLSGLYNQPLINNNYTLQTPPQKKMSSSPMAMRHSFSGSSPASERRVSPGRSVESQQNLLQYAQNQGNHIQLQSQGNHLQVQQNLHQRQPSPDRRESQFIKPLSQVGTLTTTDTEGRVRVIVGSSGTDDTGNMLANLRLGDSLRVSDDLRILNGPPITRSTSEKVPNRSELMSQVQRTMWARHTTK